MFFTNLQANSTAMGKQRKQFSIRARILSFKYAFNGIADFFLSEHNALIHFVAAVVVVGCGIWLSISRMEWVVIICLIGIVFIAELFNSAIERLGDSITSDSNEMIKKAKDLSAAAVLLAALISVLVGLIIFIPRFIDKLGLIQ